MTFGKSNSPMDISPKKSSRKKSSPMNISPKKSSRKKSSHMDISPKKSSPKQPKMPDNITLESLYDLMNLIEKKVGISDALKQQMNRAERYFENQKNKPDYKNNVDLMYTTLYNLLYNTSETKEAKRKVIETAFSNFINSAEATSPLMPDEITLKSLYHLMNVIVKKFDISGALNNKMKLAERYFENQKNKPQYENNVKEMYKYLDDLLHNTETNEAKHVAIDAAFTMFINIAKATSPIPSPPRKSPTPPRRLPTPPRRLPTPPPRRSPTLSPATTARNAATVQKIRKYMEDLIKQYDTLKFDKKVMVDAHGNILKDIYGNPIVESVLLENQSTNLLRTSMHHYENRKPTKENIEILIKKFNDFKSEIENDIKNKVSDKDIITKLKKTLTRIAKINPI